MTIAPGLIRTPHPIADIICAWANGFRVEFRYPLSGMDEKWYLCGRFYANWNVQNYSHRIHADDLTAWESFKRRPAERAADAERARIVAYIRDRAFNSPVNRTAFRVLADRISDGQDIF